MLHKIGGRQNPIGASQAGLRRASFRSRFEPIRARGFRAAGDWSRARASDGAGRHEGALGVRTLPVPVTAWLWLGRRTPFAAHFL